VQLYSYDGVDTVAQRECRLRPALLTKIQEWCDGNNGPCLYQIEVAIIAGDSGGNAGLRLATQANARTKAWFSRRLTTWPITDSTLQFSQLPLPASVIRVMGEAISFLLRLVQLRRDLAGPVGDGVARTRGLCVGAGALSASGRLSIGKPIV
jgi:hypothetical protein